MLRILLELYRKERKANFLKLEALYAGSKRGDAGRSSLSFDTFYEVFVGEYDKAITDQDVASLYREAYVAGSGTVNIDSTLLTLSDTYIIFC